MMTDTTDQNLNINEGEAGQGPHPSQKTSFDGESSIPPEKLQSLSEELIAAIKTVYDPEIPVDIYELGLIYKIDISDDFVVTVDMTLTAPGCPVAGEMPGWVKNAIAQVEDVRDVEVNMVFDPPWDMSRMSDEARISLNMI